MSLDPIIIGCDWEATITVAPGAGGEPADVTAVLAGASVVAELYDGPTRVVVFNAAVADATARTVNVTITAAETEALAPHNGCGLDIRVTTAGGKTFPVHVASRLSILLAFVLIGCGASWSTVARTSIEASAVLVDTGDSALAVAVKADCTAVVEHLDPGSPERVAAADGCLHRHHYDDAIHAVAVADHALRAAQAVVDGAERAHDAHLWTAAAPCLAVAVGDVVEALTAAGVVLPPEVLAAVTMLAAFAGTCSAAGGTQPRLAQ